MNRQAAPEKDWRTFPALRKGRRSSVGGLVADRSLLRDAIFS